MAATANNRPKLLASEALNRWKREKYPVVVVELTKRVGLVNIHDLWTSDNLSVVADLQVGRFRQSHSAGAAFFSRSPLRTLRPHASSELDSFLFLVNSHVIASSNLPNLISHNSRGPLSPLQKIPALKNAPLQINSTNGPVRRHMTDGGVLCSLNQTARPRK